MKIKVRPGLIMEIKTMWFEQKEVTEQEAKAIAYLFKHKKSIFKKNMYTYELYVSDQSYWLSLEYEPQV